MSRWIDADKCITAQFYVDEHEEWSEKSMTIAEFLDRETEEGCPSAEPRPVCKDAISRQAAIEAITKAYCNPCKERGDDYNEVRCRACNFDDAINQIDAVPPAEPTLVCEDTISRNWILTYCKEKADHYRRRIERIEEQGEAITYDPKEQLESFKTEVAIYESFAKEVMDAPPVEPKRPKCGCDCRGDKE